MPKVTYVEPDGTEHVVELGAGTTLMQGALDHLIPGIEGDCGGLCACGTCHVYVPAEYSEACGVMEELEEAILAFAYDVDGRSRLSCQITVTEGVDGLRVLLPQRQY